MAYLDGYWHAWSKEWGEAVANVRMVKIIIWLISMDIDMK